MIGQEGRASTDDSEGFLVRFYLKSDRKRKKGLQGGF